MPECAALIPISRAPQDEPDGACLLPEYHRGEHLFLHFDILKGERVFVGWEKMWDCGCKEYCECHIHGDVDPIEALKLLSSAPYPIQPLLAPPKKMIDSDPNQLWFDFTFK